MKRYNAKATGSGIELTRNGNYKRTIHRAPMEEDPKGTWVRYSAYKKERDLLLRIKQCICHDCLGTGYEDYPESTRSCGSCGGEGIGDAAEVKQALEAYQEYES